MTEEDTPLKDYGSFSHAPVGDDEIEGKRLHVRKYMKKSENFTIVE